VHTGAAVACIVCAGNAVITRAVCDTISAILWACCAFTVSAHSAILRTASVGGLKVVTNPIPALGTILRAGRCIFSEATETVATYRAVLWAVIDRLRRSTYSITANVASAAVLWTVICQRFFGVTDTIAANRAIGWAIHLIFLGITNSIPASASALAALAPFWCGTIRGAGSFFLQLTESIAANRPATPVTVHRTRDRVFLDVAVAVSAC